MTAQRLTNGELDAAIYGTPPTLVLLPRPSVPLLCAVNPRWITIPHSALEKAPTEVLPAPDSKPLPIDEKPARIEVYKPVIMNLEVAKVKGGFAVPYFNEEPLRIPMGQRKMTPFTCWYSAGSDEFWYHFEIFPGMFVGYSETTLKKLNGVG